MFVSLRADVSYSFASRGKVTFPREAKEIGDVCTQANVRLFNRHYQVENVLSKKSEIPKGRGGSRLWNSEGMGGGTHSGISEAKGGLKYGSRPWLGMDIFWNCPIKPNQTW